MDFQLEQWINHPAGSLAGVDALMRAVAGGGEVLFIALVTAWLAYGFVRSRIDDGAGASLALLASGAALAANLLISRAWTRPRPFTSHPGAVHVLLAHPPDGSFPSDHAAAAFAIAVCLFMVHRRAGIGALVFAAVLVYARVYVGNHYPGDVVVGALVGLAAAWLVVRVATRPVRAIWQRIPPGATGALRRGGA